MSKKSACNARFPSLLLACMLISSSAAAETPFAAAIQYEMDRQYDLAVEQYKIAADHGLSEAMYALGRLYREEYYDDRRSFDWFLKAANQGDAFAQYEIGLLYQLGNAVTAADSEKAAHWLTLAANKSHRAAAYQLFNLAADEAEKRKWLFKSVDWGYPEAMQSLADAYFTGALGLPMDHDLAQWWRDRAIQAKE